MGATKVCLGFERIIKVLPSLQHQIIMWHFIEPLMSGWLRNHDKTQSLIKTKYYFTTTAKSVKCASSTKIIQTYSTHTIRTFSILTQMIMMMIVITMVVMMTLLLGCQHLQTAWCHAQVAFQVPPLPQPQRRAHLLRSQSDLKTSKYGNIVSFSVTTLLALVDPPSAWDGIIVNEKKNCP